MGRGETKMKAVVCRSSQSGVWYGIMVGSPTICGDLASVSMTDARRVYSWSGAGSCSGLAAIGPLGGKIAVPVAVTVYGVSEVIEASAAAVAAFAAIDPWTGRE